MTQMVPASSVTAVCENHIDGGQQPFYYTYTLLIEYPHRRVGVDGDGDGGGGDNPEEVEVVENGSERRGISRRRAEQRPSIRLASWGFFYF
jgi:hypothetical protein